VDALLVIGEEFVFLRREAGRFKCYLEPMCRLWRSLDIVVVAPVNFLDKIECVLEPSFLSVLKSELTSLTTSLVRTVWILGGVLRPLSCNYRLGHDRSTC
jgi:hypothetical protein